MGITRFQSKPTANAIPPPIHKFFYKRDIGCSRLMSCAFSRLVFIPRTTISYRPSPSFATCEMKVHLMPWPTLPAMISWTEYLLKPCLDLYIAAYPTPFLGTPLVSFWRKTLPYQQRSLTLICKLTIALLWRNKDKCRANTAMWRHLRI